MVKKRLFAVNKRASVSKFSLSILGIIYLGLLYKLLLTPTVPSINHIRPFNLIPFRTITQNLTDGGTPLRHRAYELIGNILVLTPIGVFLAFVMSKFNIWLVILVGVDFSGVIEITQYLRWTWRVADVDDVICNSAGVLVSYVIVAYVLNHYKPKRFPSLGRA